MEAQHPRSAGERSTVTLGEPSPVATVCPGWAQTGLRAGSAPASPSPLSLFAEEELTTPVLKKAHTPPLHEDANTALIAVVITLVFLTLLTVLVVIIVYLYRNKGSYLTYEQPVAEPDVALPMEDAPAKEKEEYFI
uniref:Small cell adhesion glycoprotein n=1 Tax=Falco tinnunculus TaxID=100819 RepID=A0A8C4TVR3_FALTI